MRHAQPRYTTSGQRESVYFCNANRNKRSVVIDLKDPEGLAARVRSWMSADVVVDGSWPGAADRLGSVTSGFARPARRSSTAR